MTDDEYDYDEDDDDGTPPPVKTPPPPPSNKDLRNLRRKAQERDQMEAELAQLKRERAFSKAGIDPDDPKAKYFIKGYDGDLTDEAIRTEAEAAGFLSTAGAPGGQQGGSQQQQPQSGQQAHQRMDEVGAGVPPAPLQGDQETLAALAAAKTPEDFLAIATQRGMPTTLNRPE